MSLTTDRPRIMDDQVGVTVGGQDPRIDVGVLSPNRLHIRLVDGKSQERAKIVVQRRLAGFLIPRPGQRRIKHLYRQRIAVGEMPYHRIVPQFIRRLKRRGDQA